MNKILIIGCGHMGSALLSSWLRNTNDNFAVVDPKNYKKIKLKYKKKIATYKNIYEIKDLKKFNVIIFAVKPQIINNVLKIFSNIIFNKETLFISIIAGKNVRYFQKLLKGKNQIIRVMPNMPASIEQGMTCMFSNKQTTNRNKKFAKNLFQKVGKVILFNKEEYLDKVTAISGSGPGYFYLFIYLFELSAIKVGFNKKVAKELAMQTAFGATSLLNKSNHNSKKLMQNIAISGGTTEAGLNKFLKDKKLEKLINSAVKAALKRAKALGKNNA